MELRRQFVVMEARCRAWTRSCSQTLMTLIVTRSLVQAHP
uniref:Uncharacterized protein n=1 Tax=Arundo donax TaxID=35708 RepID=A0A0A9DBX5_ARUDO